VQMPSAAIPRVSPSPFASLKALESILNWVEPPMLRKLAKDSCLSEFVSRYHLTPAGKQFHEQTFRAAVCQSGYYK
jgi:hypothetical protein